jgi:hypothetical protein
MGLLEGQAQARWNHGVAITLAAAAQNVENWSLTP